MKDESVCQHTWRLSEVDKGWIAQRCVRCGVVNDRADHWDSSGGWLYSPPLSPLRDDDVLCFSEGGAK